MRATRDAIIWGGTASRFDTRAQTTHADINAMNEVYHAGRGASGQGRDDANETMSYARMARAGQAPRATPYSTTEGGRTGASGLNRRNGMIEAKSADPAQNFAIENPFESFASDPVKPCQAAINALAASKSGHENEQLTAHWLQYVGSAQNGTPTAQRKMFRGKQELTSPRPGKGGGGA